MSLYEMRNTVAGRVTGALAAFALVVGLSFGGAVAAQADDTSDLQAEIDRLLTLIEQLQSQLGGSTVTPPAGDFTYTFTRNLTIGATGEDVRMLQRYLNRNTATQVAPAGVAGGPEAETSYYGPATAAAVKKYQELHAADILHPLGLTVGTPNFGASTRAFMNKEIAAGGSTTTPPTPGPGKPGDLKGGEGDIVVEAYPVSVELGTSETDVIYEFEVEAFDSDIAVNRVDLLFQARTGGSLKPARPWVAFDEVVLFADGKEVGVLTRERDYTRVSTDHYRARFSGLDVVIREGDIAEFTVEATAAGVIRNVEDVEFDVYLDGDSSVRGVDALGLVQLAGVDLVSGSVPTSARSLVEFTDTYGEGKLRVRNNNSPREGHVFNSDDTRDAVVLAFSAEAQENDVTLEEVEVVLTDGTSPATNVEDVITRLELRDGRTVLASERVTGDGTHTLEIRRGFDIREGRTANLEVVAVFERDAAGQFSVALGDLHGVNRNGVSFTTSSALSRTLKVVSGDKVSVEFDLDESQVVYTADREGVIELYLWVDNESGSSVSTNIGDWSYSVRGVREATGADVSLEDGNVATGNESYWLLEIPFDGTTSGRISVTLTKVGDLNVPSTTWTE